MTIGGNPSSEIFWKPVIDKIRARLSSCKGKLLSMADRVCLLKSIICALPLFYLSFFKAPVCVCNTVKRIQAKFLWGYGHDSMKITWVTWENICNPTQVGRLGIKNIAKFNVALLAKCKYRIRLDEEGLWKEVVQSRYGSWRDMSSNRLDNRHSRWWRDL